jgi:hypothetical protein
MYKLIIRLLRCLKSKGWRGKVVPVLNYEPHHEDLLGGGGIAPRTFDLNTRWRWDGISFQLAIIVLAINLIGYDIAINNKIIFKI